MRALRRLLRAVRGLRDLPGRVLRGQQRHPVQLPGHRRSAATARPRPRRDRRRSASRCLRTSRRMFSFHTPALADGTSLLWTVGQAPQPAIGVTPASQDFGTVAGRRVGGPDLRGQEHGHRDTDGRRRRRTRRSASCRAARTRSPRARRRRSPCASAPTTAGARSSRCHVHRWRQSFATRERHRRRGERRARSADGARAAQDGWHDGACRRRAGRTRRASSSSSRWSMRAPSTRSRPRSRSSPSGTAFTGAGLWSGPAVASTGAPVQGVVTVTGLMNGSQYHWRARTRDAAGLTSGWVSFGGNAETRPRRRRRHRRADRLDRRGRPAARGRRRAR